jgi:ethanolamine ammonia-lyase large subunit
MNYQEIITTFTLSNEFKEGDLLVGGTQDPAERHDARQRLAALRVSDIAATRFVADQVTDALSRWLDRKLLNEMSALTLGDIRRVLISENAASWVAQFRDGLPSEVIAGVVKLMTEDELGGLCRKLFNPLPGAGIAIGSAGHFGSRIQPNSPGDDEDEILMSILEGLAFGCGDVIIGLNPASDDVETIIRLEDLLRSVVERLRLPTRYCVLSDIVKQTSARARTTVDIGFQSLAGTSKAIAGMVGLDVEGLLDLARGFPGLYFETGQGSAVTNGAAEGIDMVTLEARAYGVARLIQRRTGAWTIVNDVAGFIGPEVFRSGNQLFRACLEDTAMGKLHGLTMGLDVCSTFHMGIDPAGLGRLTKSIAAQAAPAYLMAVAGNADPMLGYMTTSFREHPALRNATGARMSSPMAARLHSLGIAAPGDTGSTGGLYAKYMRAGGDTRSTETLSAEGERKTSALRDRGFDLGYAASPDGSMPMEAADRLETIYRNARAALYATIDKAVISDCCPRSVRISTDAADREQYLSHPALGEQLSRKSESTLFSLYPVARPAVQIVISDGLNANAVNDNLRRVLIPLRQNLAATGCHTGDIDIIIDNARVRAGYNVGKLLGSEVIVHLIGERPGTGINQMSAYLTYGRDKTGRARWSLDLDHSLTTAICGINNMGKPPAIAVEEITACVAAMLKDRCSGVELAAKSAKPLL